MARTNFSVTYTSFEHAKSMISSILIDNGYREITENGEVVWKKGTGFWEGMKYIKCEFAPDNKIILSGWIRAVGGGEQNLKGFVGWLPKKHVLEVITEIQSRVR